MIDDLRHLPPDSFQLVTQEICEYALVALLFACFIFDRMGWLS